MKTFQTTFRNTRFSKEDPISVFDFLPMFVKKANSLGVFEAHVFLQVQKLLSDRVERHRRSICNGARSGGVVCLPEAVGNFLRTHAPPTNICNAVADLRKILYQHQKDGFTYSRPMNDAVHRCGNVHEEIDKMTLFVDGLLSIIQTIVVLFQQSKKRLRLSYEELVQFSYDEAKSHLRRKTSPRMAKIVNTNKHGQAVHLIEPRACNGQSIEDGEQLCVICNGLKLSNKLLSTVDTPSSQPLR